jgi:hypothetical protein
MDKRKLTESEEAAIRSDTRRGDKTAQPLDTDDNDEVDADAVGDSEDETEDENLAPDTWQKGEE